MIGPNTIHAGTEGHFTIHGDDEVHVMHIHSADEPCQYDGYSRVNAVCSVWGRFEEQSIIFHFTNRYAEIGEFIVFPSQNSGWRCYVC